MPSSQLKQLKASLREHGVLGPQKSKKQKKANSKDAQKRLQRNAALDMIRERFNPFEVKAPSRRDKFEVSSNKSLKAQVGRPGVTRGLGEERRRDTLLKEIQTRNKVGGLLDRRFGENDPTMTPEQKAAERFARQNEKKMKKTSMFNLEDDSDEEIALTHGGRSLDFGDRLEDDFQEDAEGLEPEDDFEAQDDRPRKRLRLEADEDVDEREEDEELVQRKKTKNEVMKEIIAKSKMYKAERQAAKADDDDLRMELDKGMSEFYEALRGHKPAEKAAPTGLNTDSEPIMNPDRAAMLAGKSREAAEKEYEENLRKLKLEARSKPSMPTKSEEEKAAEEASKLEELERQRIRRMKGEVDSSDDDASDDVEVEIEDERDDAENFGLAQPQYHAKTDLDVEDEDEFVLDDDLIASASDPDLDPEQDSEDSDEDAEIEDDGDDDFINGLVLPQSSIPANRVESQIVQSSENNLAYTFPCPQTHEELLDAVKDTNVSDLPVIVQRIRALYHKGLAPGNQEKLANFAAALTQHLVYLADTRNDLPISVAESLLRHLHSMAKVQPEAVGMAFRKQLRDIADHRPLELTPGDLMLLSGISVIFPTSDQFHTVVTPAMLTMSRYLGQSSVQNLQDLGTGAFCCTLVLRYQGLAKRYVPEVIAYLVNALALLAPNPVPEKDRDGKELFVSLRSAGNSLCIKPDAPEPAEKLSFDLVFSPKKDGDNRLATTLLSTFIRLSECAVELWKEVRAFPEVASPFIHVLRHLSHQSALPKNFQSSSGAFLKRLKKLQAESISSRVPLLLHNHRPLAIKTSVPSFIDNYNPDRHYDPDPERGQLSKLKAEHKRERKGAMRELRKDANFIARESLREKKEKDEAYEKKFKRLVAEIQGEEGREAKEYAREKMKRKGRF